MEIYGACVEMEKANPPPQKPRGQEVVGSHVVLSGRATQTTYEHSYIPVTLDISPIPHKPKTLHLPEKRVSFEDQLKTLIDKGQSLGQIAEKIGASKSWVVDQAQKYQIEVPKKGRMTNPENYRHHCLPFGFRKKGNKLYPCQRQQRTCRLVVQLKKRDGLSFNSIAKKVASSGHLNGRGGIYWDHKATKKIFEAWKDKY